MYASAKVCAGIRVPLATEGAEDADTQRLIGWLLGAGVDLRDLPRGGELLYDAETRTLRGRIRVGAEGKVPVYAVRHWMCMSHPPAGSVDFLLRSPRERS